MLVSFDWAQSVVKLPSDGCSHAPQGANAVPAWPGDPPSQAFRGTMMSAPPLFFLTGKSNVGLLPSDVQIRIARRFSTRCALMLAAVPGSTPGTALHGITFLEQCERSGESHHFSGLADLRGAILCGLNIFDAGNVAASMDPLSM